MLSITLIVSVGGVGSPSAALLILARWLATLLVVLLELAVLLALALLVVLVLGLKARGLPVVLLFL